MTLSTIDFQERIDNWMQACFGPEIAADGVERNHRFLEEALELVQSLGCSISEAHQLVDYVFARPLGDPGQEVGGVMVTLAALCNAHEIGVGTEANREHDRIWQKVDAIRAKQAAKPKHSPLPAPAPYVEPLTSIADRVRELVDVEGDGAWRSCTGCYETEDGHPVGLYPFSQALKCPLGSGCSECGGIGAVWDNADWEEFVDHSIRFDRDVTGIKATLVAGGVDAWRAETLASEIACLSAPQVPAVGPIVGIDDDTRLRLEKLAGELDRTVDDLAQCAIAEAALDAFRSRDDDPAK